MSDNFSIKIQPGKPIQKIQIGELVKENNPVLREVCKTWDFSGTGMPMPAIEIARILIDTAKAYGALGLAAPQIGYPYRVFCIGSGDQWQICFNPLYTATLGYVEGYAKPFGLKKHNEGCLSFPGLLLPVERPQKIEATFYMPNGEQRIETYEGMTARAFAHEYDHLNGVLFIDYVGEMRLLMAREKRKKLIRKLERRNNKPKR